MQEITIYEPLYQVNITYLIGCTIPELKKLLKQRHGKYTLMSWDKPFKFGKLGHTTDGYQFHVDAPYGEGETFYVWMWEATPSLLYHETSHLVGDILFNRGFEYSYGSEEAYAYLGGWIFQEVSKQLNKPE